MVRALCRLACYSQLSHFGTPWAVLPIELFHGMTFGCSWAAGTVNCSRISPPGLKSTTQVRAFSLSIQHYGLMSSAAFSVPS